MFLIEIFARAERPMSIPLVSVGFLSLLVAPMINLWSLLDRMVAYADSTSGNGFLGSTSFFSDQIHC